MKSILLNIFCFCLLFFNFFGQINAQTRTIKGKVTDAKTGEVVPFANVAFPAKNPVIGDQTDFDGLYSFEVPDSTITISASYVGYHIKKVVVPATQNEVNIALEEESELLEATEVIHYCGGFPSKRIYRKVMRKYRREQKRKRKKEKRQERKQQ